MILSLRVLGQRLFALAKLEGRQAGVALAWMAGIALCVAVLAITGWLALLACVLVVLVENEVLGWGPALGIAGLFSFALAGGLVLIAANKSRHLRFAATRRQFAQSWAAGDPT